MLVGWPIKGEDLLTHRLAQRVGFILLMVPSAQRTSRTVEYLVVRSSAGPQLADLLHKPHCVTVHLYLPPTYQRLSTLHYKVAHCVEPQTSLTPNKSFEVYDGNLGHHHRPGSAQQRRRPAAIPGSKS
jgi:hypothetical protein